MAILPVQAGENRYNLFQISLNILYPFRVEVLPIQVTGIYAETEAGPLSVLGHLCHE